MADVVARDINGLKLFRFTYLSLILLIVTLLACGTDAAQQSAPAVLPATAQATATSIAVPPTPTPSPEPAPSPEAAPSTSVTSTTVPPSPSSAGTVPEVPQNGASAPQMQETPKELASRISMQAMEFLTSFVRDYRPNPSGSEEERIAAEFLAGELRETGYEGRLQSFTIEYISRDVPALTLLAPEQRNVLALPMTMSGTGKVVGPLAHVARAMEGDIPAEGLSGKIALIQRGEITFEEKVTRVAQAGAIAAVIYNNVPGGFGGSLMNPASIPAVSITKEDGEAILKMMEAGEVEAQVIVEVQKRDSQNVIAEKPGTSGDEKVVIIGAHYDSVPNTQGAGDNGTGVAALMMLAREIRDKEYPFDVRFILFGVEEIGLFGSRHYVSSLNEQERENIVAMLNFDAIGAGEPSITGDMELTARVMEYASAHSFDINQSAGLRGGSSDHAPFQAVGIPAIFFYGDDFSRINSPADTLNLVKPELMGIQAALGLGLLEMLARTVAE